MSYQEEFINKIAPLIQKEAKNRGYKIASTVIAQAICESNWGRSKLSASYGNYFGLKCGSSWKGKSVNMKTREEYKAGTLTVISSNWRVYQNMEEGVSGYYDFISTKRYANLKTAQTYKQYAEYLKSDGYATSSTYVNTLCSIVSKYNLEKYDNLEESVPVVEVPDELKIAIDIFANYVIKGYFGSGSSRKENIYKTVQNKVNEMLRR